MRELALLNLDKSPDAPKRVYRALRSGLTRYDIELEKGWYDHVTNTKPIKTVESPSAHSPTGRIVLESGDVLDDVDVCCCRPPSGLRPEDAMLDVLLTRPGHHLCHRLRLPLRVLPPHGRAL